MSSQAASTRSAIAKLLDEADVIERPPPNGRRASSPPADFVDVEQ
jgi:hypothetical protein